MKPIFKYPGGKTRELINIRKYYPEKVDIFIEPFVGAGAVFWDFEDADEFHINDISKDLTNIYKFIKSQDHTFYSILHEISEDWDNILNNKKLNYPFDQRKYEWFYDRKRKKMSEEDAHLTSLKSSYFVNIRNIFNSERNEKKKSAYYLFIMTFAFSSLFQYNLNGDLNIPYGGKGYNNKSFTNVINKTKEDHILKKLNKTKIFNEDFDTFLSRYKNKKDIFVFIDPPYVSDMIYNGIKFTQNDQIRLVKITKNLNNFLSVIGEDAIIKNLYKKYDFSIDKKPINFSMSFKGRNITKKHNLYISNKI